jgi:hypothetical protein
VEQRAKSFRRRPHEAADLFIRRFSRAAR